MHYFAENTKLQTVLSAYTSCQEVTIPHHPLTCNSKGFEFYPDNSLACEHIRTKANDDRTHQALQASIAILLLECAYDKYRRTDDS